MIKHEEKRCPRCLEKFECKVGSISICQCTTVALNDEERGYIRQRFHDCLCVKCMLEIRTEYNQEVFNHKLKNLLRG